MSDNQFDNFINGKLKDHSAPVPSGLWDKVKDTQLDHFIGDKLKNYIAPVPTDLWDKVTDIQFDNFIGDTLNAHVAPVPGNLWERITDGQFDNFVAGKLTDHTALVPAGLWEKVRPKDDNDRKGFIFFRNPAAALVLLALLLGGSLGGYLYFHSQKNTGAAGVNINTNPAINAITPDTKEKIQEHAAIPGNTNASAITPATPADPSYNEQKNNSQANQSDNNQPANAGSQPTTHSAFDEFSRHEGLSNHLPPVNQLSTTGNNQKTSSINPSTGFNLRPNSSTTVNGGIPVYKDGIVNSNNFAINNATDTDDNSIELIPPYQSNLLTAVTIPTNTARFNGLQRLLDKQLGTTRHTSEFRNVIICPSDNKNRNTDWFLEAYVSPDLAFKSVTNNTASQQYLLRKDSSESSQIGYSAGLRLVKPITDNIILKTGVQYTQMNQKYVYRTENEIKTITVVSVRTIIRAPGDTVIVRDTSILQQIGFRNNTVVNRFRSFDIPVTVGYQFGNEDLKIGINAGVVFNISSWYQGVILDSSLATVPLVKGSNSMVYKNNIGIGLYGGISIIKRLSDDLHIFAEPYFRYNLSSMTTPQAAYNQKFSLGGLSIGLRFNLNRK